jgi:hypothetical protein
MGPSSAKKDRTTNILYTIVMKIGSSDEPLCQRRVIRSRSKLTHRIHPRLERIAKKVKVLVVTREPGERQELPVHPATGPEVGLIKMIRPSWNIRGRVMTVRSTQQRLRARYLPYLSQG